MPRPGTMTPANDYYFFCILDIRTNTTIERFVNDDHNDANDVGIDLTNQQYINAHIDGQTIERAWPK